MKTIVPAALVLVLEAGFLFSIAALPAPAAPVRGAQQVAGRPAPAPAPASVASGTEDRGPARPTSRS